MNITPTPTEALSSFLVARLLGDEAHSQYISGRIPKTTLTRYVQAIHTISSRYTSHKVGTSLGQSVHNQVEATAYALYYVPINFAKVSWLLAKLTLPEDYSLLDFGSGPGTAGLAAVFSDRKPKELVCLDSSAAMRMTAQKLLTTFVSEVPLLKFETASSLSEIPTTRRFDVIVAANVLAETSVKESHSISHMLKDRLSEGGHLILIEPGQPEHTRRLMSLRDTICQELPEMVPTFPCCSCQPCPMLLTSNSNWCHGNLTWKRSLLTEQLDECLEFNKHRLKFSAFIFTKNGALKSGYRVVEPGERSKRGIEATLCGGDFYGRVRLKPTERSESNRALERSGVFDLLELSHPAQPELPSDTKVYRLE